MTTAMLDELVGDPRLLYRHTVDEYHQMFATGAVEEGAPFELLDGPCVIEVADASLKRDRGYKQRVYADSGIPAYVIVNLSDRVVELYTRPMKGKGRYGQSVTLTSRQRVSISLLGGKPFAVPVRTLLPSSNSTS